MASIGKSWVRVAQPRERRLTKEQIERIRAWPRTYKSGKAFAAEFGVSASLITLIRQDWIYRDAEPRPVTFVHRERGRFRVRLSLKSYATRAEAEVAARYAVETLTKAQSGECIF